MEWLHLAAVLALAISPLLLPTGGPNVHRHDFVRTDPDELGAHFCGPGLGYCHHVLKRCACGKERIAGYSVEEVR